jgi:hypothetical protein
MFSTPRLIAVAVLGFVFGAAMFIFWLPRLAEMGSPIMHGKVIARTPITEWSVPRVDFSIELLDDPQVTVHAHTQRYLIDQVPERVRFHYSGDPAREVFLFEHEENPLWIALFCWAAAAFLGFVVYYRWRAGRAVSVG